MFERIILILLDGFECLSYGMTAPNDMSATTVPSASGKPSLSDIKMKCKWKYIFLHILQLARF